MLWQLSICLLLKTSRVKYLKVGMRVQFDHLQPTPVGAEVFAEAVLKKIDGRRITFEVSATDAGGLIGAGKITRVVVGIDEFMGKCCAPSD